MVHTARGNDKQLNVHSNSDRRLRPAARGCSQNGFDLTKILRPALCVTLAMLALASAAFAAVAAAAPVVRVEPYGPDAFRVRVAPPGHSVTDDTMTALQPSGPSEPAAASFGDLNG